MHVLVPNTVLAFGLLVSALQQIPRPMVLAFGDPIWALSPNFSFSAPSFADFGDQSRYAAPRPPILRQIPGPTHVIAWI